MFWLTLQRYYACWQARKTNGLSRKYNASAGNRLVKSWLQDHIQSKQDWKETDFLVIDIETSSLDVKTGEVLSIGWVQIKQGRILMNTAEHLLLKPKNSVGESATIHQLRDCELDEGISEVEMMERFLEVATNKVLVCHHRPLDIGFLDDVSRKIYGMPLLRPVVDTLQIEKHMLEKKNIPIGDSVLRLASCRVRYNLPFLPAHNALVDALATAELLLAQIAYKGKTVLLKDLV